MVGPVGRWFPIWGSNAVEDRGFQCLDGWVGVRLEEAVINLVECISNGLGFVGQLDREGCFEVRDELWY